MSYVVYSGTSDKGHSLLRAQYKKKKTLLLLRTRFLAPNYTFLKILKRGNLSIKDSNGQKLLILRCPLLRGFTVQG